VGRPGTRQASRPAQLGRPRHERDEGALRGEMLPEGRHEAVLVEAELAALLDLCRVRDEPVGDAEPADVGADADLLERLAAKGALLAHRGRASAGRP